MNRRTLLLVALTLAAASRGTSAMAESAEVSLTPNRAVELIIDSALDDTHYRYPRGYQHHGAANHIFQRRLTLTNTGSTPLTGPLLVINGVDWNSSEALRRSLNLNGPARDWMPRLFTFWIDHISHADSDIDGGKEPFALLNFWGYALCGDTTTALTQLATACGVPARKIPLNGHVAAEYFYDDAWHIFDADQNICYLRLDNRTLASAADLRADPLLARRTKALGRHASMEPALLAFNTSLHEFIDPKETKPVKLKTPPAPVRDVTLFPGEKMIVHAAQSPDVAVGRSTLNHWGRVREEALRVVEYALNPRTRSKGKDTTLTFAAGFPILRAVNHTTGETVSIPPTDPAFEITVKLRSPDDQISVFCQRSNASLPCLRQGPNTILLATRETTGTAELSAEWTKPEPDSILPRAAAKLAATAPIFEVTAQPAADLLWWQIAPTADFAFVGPNFEAVTAFNSRVAFDPLTATFFNPDIGYFFRVKVRAAGVWSEWSEALEFRVEKPPRPAPVQATVASSRLRLTWPDAGEGAEYQVFGSNRRDFLPEPFAEEEIVKLRNQGIKETRPNENLVATVTKAEIELEPTFHFYRVLTRRAGVLSTPGDLIITPAALTGKLSPALILQDRWQRVNGQDEHLATEMPLPAP